MSRRSTDSVLRRQLSRCMLVSDRRAEVGADQLSAKQTLIEEEYVA